MESWLVKKLIHNWQEVSNPQVRTQYGKLASWVGLFCNTLLCVSKLLVGLLTGSVAIMGDAVNNLSDASSSIVTLVGFRMAAKPPDKEHPFGHARSEYIAGLAVAIFVLIIGVELLRSSVGKIVEPTPVTYTFASIVVLILSILIKLWMALFNRKIGLTIHSEALIATFADSRNDVIATTVVLIAAVISRFTGWVIDGYMGLAVAAFVIYSGILLVKDTINPLLGTAPNDDLVEKLQATISSYPGVLGTHDLIVHDYGFGQRFASAHVEMNAADNVLQSHSIIDQIEIDIRRDFNIHLIIHYDPVLVGDDIKGTQQEKVMLILQAINSDITMHDFYCCCKQHEALYRFDIVLPHSFADSDELLRQTIMAELQNLEENKQIELELDIDRSYAAMPK